MTTITVTNNSGANVPGSLLAAIQTAAISVQPVTIDFLDTVLQIDLNGSNTVSADNLTIDGAIASGRVLIRNINSVVASTGVFIVAGTLVTPLTGFHIANLEMTALAPTQPCRFFSITDVNNFTVTNCFLHDNNAGLSANGGGAFFVARCPVFNLLNSVFTTLSASNAGACNFSVSSGSINFCQFTGNTATTNSGAVSATGLGANTVMFNTCIFNNNAAGGISSSSGAVFVATLTANFTSCTFQANTAPGMGGAMQCASGAPVTVDQCLFENNTASVGGAIASTGSALTITLSTIRSNTATNVAVFPTAIGGGGIFITNSGLQLISSLINGNTSAGGGGGIAVEILNIGQTLFFNSTIYGNNASGLTGGGIRQYNNAGAITLTNCTIAANNAAVSGGGIFTLAGLMTLGNNILATNTSVVNPDITGTIISQGTNLVGIATPANGFGGTDLTGTAVTPLDPEIGPLSDNGGVQIPGAATSTFSVALFPTSPAVDAGNTALLPAIPLAAFDQRGQAPFARVSDNQPGPLVDIGSFEMQQVVICFRKGSQVLVKDTNTNEVHTIDIARVLSDLHTVYDVVTDSFVPIIYNAVGAKNSEFYRLGANLFGENIPSADLDVTGPHLILQGGQRTPASDIPGAVRIETDHELVYSICTEGESTILVNNLGVIGWDSVKWDKYASKRNISWTNNL